MDDRIMSAIVQRLFVAERIPQRIQRFSRATAFGIESEQTQANIRHGAVADSKIKVGINCVGGGTGLLQYLDAFMKGQNRWGFLVSPEVGFNYYPWANSVGFHLALYYNYATNKRDIMTYSQNGLNNIGFRVGLAF